jgi:ABC-type uncharacterized transport system substrate-binding protein
VEGDSIEFEIRHAVGNPDQFPILAAELVQANAEVIVTNTAGLAAVALKVTSSIPIVTSGGDLEGAGLVSSLRKPGGSVTGIQILSPELMSKRLDLLKHLIPTLARVGLSIGKLRRQKELPRRAASARRPSARFAIRQCSLGSSRSLPASSGRDMVLSPLTS